MPERRARSRHQAGCIQLCKEPHSQLQGQQVLKAERRRHMTVAGLMWLALGALTYATGWSVGWVRRGFRMAAQGDKLRESRETS
jgi:hypothetical protein